MSRKNLNTAEKITDYIIDELIKDNITITVFYSTAMKYCDLPKNKNDQSILEFLPKNEQGKIIKKIVNEILLNDDRFKTINDIFHYILDCINKKLKQTKQKLKIVRSKD